MKSEIRMTKSERNPKPKSGADAGVSPALQPLQRWLGAFRFSDFRILSTFGFRISDLF